MLVEIRIAKYLAGVDGDRESLATGVTAQHALERARRKQKRRGDSRPLTVQKLPPHIIDRILRRGPRIDPKRANPVPPVRHPFH